MARREPRRLVRAGGAPVCDRCDVADNPLTRLRGLLGRAGLANGEGLLIRPTSSIHTCFMRFPIDAVFLDAKLTVLDVRHDVKPWRTALKRGAKSVLELPAGEAARRGVERGATLRLSAS